MRGVEIVAACDARLELAQAAAPSAYTDAAVLMAAEALDFVDIATRPASHLPLVRMAVERGIASICQKPMTEDMAQALEMLRMVKQSGARVMVHENWRWQPWFREAKRLIAGGAIGQPLTYRFHMRQRDGLGDRPYPNQPYFREMPRLLLYETLIHPIDTARFLFGEIDVVQAHLRRVNPGIAGEDRAIALLVHANGIDGIADGHRFLNADPPGPAMGESVFEGGEAALKILANGESYLNGKLVFSHPADVGYKGDSVRATQSHFIDCLHSGAPFETGVEEYLPSFAAVEAGYRSVAEQRAVRVAELL